MALIILKPENNIIDLLSYQEQNIQSFFVLQKQDIFKDIVVLSTEDEIDINVNRPFRYNIDLLNGKFNGNIITMVRYKSKNKGEKIIADVLKSLNGFNLVSKSNDDDILVLFWNTISEYYDYKNSLEFKLLTKYMYSPLVIMYKRVFDFENIEKQSKELQENEYKKIKIKS